VPKRERASSDASAASDVRHVVAQATFPPGEPGRLGLIACACGVEVVGPDAFAEHRRAMRNPAGASRRGGGRRGVGPTP
jgi:hypothetical protein